MHASVALASPRSRWNAGAVRSPLQILRFHGTNFFRAGAEDQFKGVIDLVKMKAIVWTGEELGAKFEEQEIPEDMKEKVRGSCRGRGPGSCRKPVGTCVLCTVMLTPSLSVV